MKKFFLTALFIALGLCSHSDSLATIASQGNLVPGGASCAATTSGNSLVCPADTNALTVGNIGIAVVGSNNVGTTNANHNEHSSIDDSSGANTWIKLCEFTTSAGAPADGATISMWMTKVAGQVPATTGTYTVNFANTITARSARFWEFSVNSGNILVLADPCQTEALNTGDAGPLQFTGLPNQQYLFIRGIVQENDETANFTISTGYLNLFAEAIGDGGADADSIRTDAEFDIDTATGSTSDPTMTDTNDSIVSVFVALREVTPSTKRAIVITVD